MVVLVGEVDDRLLAGLGRSPNVSVARAPAAADAADQPAAAEPGGAAELGDGGGRPAGGGAPAVGVRDRAR